MKMYRNIFTFFTIALTSVAMAGVERGGGVPPAPQFMPEDATYVCDVKLTQLNAVIHRPVVSRTSATFSWKKGGEARPQFAYLDKLGSWKHYTLEQSGPFLPTEKEVAQLPDGAALNGVFSLGAPRFYPGWNSENVELIEGLDQGFLFGLTVYAQAKDKVKNTYSEANTKVFKTIQSRKTLTTETRVAVKGEHGNIIDQQLLKVTCKRTE